MSEELRHIPLDAIHRALGARFGAFAGFDMPIQYPEGLRSEHLHTRDKVGLFDVSHMGQLRARARDARVATLHAELERALPVDFDVWPIGMQKYSLLLNDTGGVEDDLMLVHLPDEVRLIVNAGNRDHDLALLRERCPHVEFTWVDAALIALQGPHAERVLAGLDPAAEAMRFMEARELTLLGVPCFTTRSGYTGEDGYEISIPAGEAPRVAERLLEDRSVRPVGLGARDTLRLEAGLPLHGHEITPNTLPIEAGLGFGIPKSRRVGPKAGGFPGAGPILEQIAQGTRRKLVGLASYEAIPIRAHAAIVTEDGRQVGEVTSGTISPTLNHPVMLAYIEQSILDDTGKVALHAIVRDKRPAVHVTPLPFVPKRYKR